MNGVKKLAVIVGIVAIVTFSASITLAAWLASGLFGVAMTVAVLSLIIFINSAAIVNGEEKGESAEGDEE